jgi:hypothetical protein
MTCKMITISPWYYFDTGNECDSMCSSPHCQKIRQQQQTAAIVDAVLKLAPEPAATSEHFAVLRVLRRNGVAAVPAIASA